MNRFKIGDTIHYMYSNKPESKEIIGICTVEGAVKTSGLDEISKNGVSVVLYFTGSYSSVKESEAFSSLDELKESLFNIPTKIN